jgi:hypothetical protein
MVRYEAATNDKGRTMFFLTVSGSGMDVALAQNRMSWLKI